MIFSLVRLMSTEAQIFELPLIPCYANKTLVTNLTPINAEFFQLHITAYCPYAIVTNIVEANLKIVKIPQFLSNQFGTNCRNVV